MQALKELSLQMKNTFSVVMLNKTQRNPKAGKLKFDFCLESVLKVHFFLNMGFFKLSFS